MRDIQRIQVLHDLSSTFKIDDEAVKKLKDQIQDADKRDNLERFFKGYRVEDAFLYHAAALPWVRCIHPLDQNQQPGWSREEFQVPDHMVFFEDFPQRCFPLLVDVKSVKDTQQKVELMTRQSTLLSAYATVVNLPLVYAVYWAKWSIWTLNPPDQFNVRGKKLVLSLAEAVKGDVSSILGNVVFHIPILHRQCTWTKATKPDETIISHPDHGHLLVDRIARDDMQFMDLAPGDSLVLDSFANMEEITVERLGDLTKTTERTSEHYMLSLGNLIDMCLSRLPPETVERENYKRVMAVIDAFMKKFHFEFSHPIPNSASPMTVALMKTAYEASSIFGDYKQAHNLPD